MQRFLTEPEIKAVKNHLLSYQKGGQYKNWDEYRNKIDNGLLTKFNLLRKTCRENGFINPHVSGGKIFWMQIIGKLDPDILSNPCLLCENSLLDGSCKGQLKIHKTKRRNKGKDFIPCWQNDQQRDYMKDKWGVTWDEKEVEDYQNKYA